MKPLSKGVKTLVAAVASTTTVTPTTTTNTNSNPTAAQLVTETATSSTNNANDAAMWHNRLGHLNVASMNELHKLVDGFSWSPNSSLIKTEQCRGCMQGKSHRVEFPKVATTRATQLLELVHSDICGPFNVSSHGGSYYFITFIDDYSRFTRVMLLGSKDKAYQSFIEYHVWAEKQTGHRIKALRTDGGGESLSG